MADIIPPLCLAAHWQLSNVRPDRAGGLTEGRPSANAQAVSLRVQQRSHALNHGRAVHTSHHKVFVAEPSSECLHNDAPLSAPTPGC